MFRNKMVRVERDSPNEMHFKMDDTTLSVSFLAPNHYFFATPFGETGYFDLLQDEDGAFKLFRNAGLGRQAEMPISPADLPGYLLGVLDAAQIAMARWKATRHAGHRAIPSVQ